MKQETMQIERFTVNDVIPTKILHKMSRLDLITKYEKLEKHAIQLDQGLSVMLENIQSVKKASLEDTEAFKPQDEDTISKT